MQFNSYLFILGVLPAFVAGYFLLSKVSITFGKFAVIAFSAFFYIYGGLESALILGISVLINGLFSYLLTKYRSVRKQFLVAAIILNVGLLLYFKYLNFALTIVNKFCGDAFTLKNLLLPLGISFFTFQQIMYVLAVYRGELEQVNVTDYLCYVLYFPKLIMGPLTEPKAFIEQLNDSKLKTINWDNIAYGVKLFGFGLFKKVILADTFTRGVAWGFSNLPTATSADMLLVMLMYTFEIYFDFSGYSDMAAGISQMINITLPMNFDSPYKAVSIRDFWKRWHMSLTSFFTRNVYFPLGGSRKGTVRTYLNILLVFLVSGLWHGAQMTFVLWGCLHGVLQILERVLDKPLKRCPSLIKQAFTFLAVNVLWLLFRSNSISGWANIQQDIFTFHNMKISEELISTFVLPETAFIMNQFDFLGLNTLVRGLPMWGMLAGAALICFIPENNYRNMKKLTLVNMALCSIAFVWAFLCLSSESVFVYFGF